MNLQPFKFHKADKICSRCIMDDSVQGISFDENGVCTLCHIHDEMEATYAPSDSTTQELKLLIEKIKRDGKHKKYDCVVGVSGGRDSTYTLYSVVKLGLRPLAVHFDNGWNTESAIQNIKNACNILGVDLHTHVADWEEFKDIQRAFLQASVPDAEAPNDWVITSVLFKEATREGLKYIIHGHSFRTEGTTPPTWTYMDGRYVNHIQKRFGSKQINSFQVMTMSQYFYYTFLKKIQQVRLLYYLPYNESEILEKLTKELNWKDYGGKHHESKYTGFFQSYILTRKFNIDKRKLHYSALIRSGQMTREEALQKVKVDPYEGGIETLDYCLKKLGYTHDEFEEIMNENPKLFTEYKSYYSLARRFKGTMAWGAKLGIITESVYRKLFRFDI